MDKSPAVYIVFVQPQGLLPLITLLAVSHEDRMQRQITDEQALPIPLIDESSSDSSVWALLEENMEDVSQWLSEGGARGPLD